MSEYSKGALRRVRLTHKTSDGKEAAVWCWRGVVTIKGDDGRRRHKQTNLKDDDGNPIECDPETDRERGHRTIVSGKGAAKAQKALDSWIDGLKAEEEREAQRRAQEERMADDPAYVLVADYLDAYVDRRERGARPIEASTARSYHVTANQIRRYWPDKRLFEVRTQDVIALEDAMAMDGLSISSIRKVHVMLHTAFVECVANDILGKDPTIGTKAPTPKKEHPNSYAVADLPLVAEKLAQLPLSAPVVAANLALFCGIRRGEAAGLKWSDIDLDAGFFVVRRAIGSGEHGKPYAKLPKTNQQRAVPIPAQLRRVLIAWRGKVAETALSLGVGDISDWYVCGKPDGSPSDLDYLSKCWHAMAESFGIAGIDGRPVSLHGLRHSYANGLVHGSDVDIKTVSAILGHSSVSVTLNTYAEDDPSVKLAAAKEVDRVFTPAPAEVVRLDRTGTE